MSTPADPAGRPAWDVDDDPAGEPFGPGGWADGTTGYAVAGLLAGVVGLLVAELLDLVLTVFGWPGSGSAGRSPVLAVGGAFVDLTPSWLKEWAVASFGTGDKAVLFVGMAIVLLLAFAAIGLLARRRHTAAVAGLGAIGLLALLALATRPGAAGTDLFPTVVGLAVAAWTLSSVRTRTAAQGPTRRVTLGFAGGTVALVSLLLVRGRGTLGAADAVVSRASASVPTGLPVPASVGADLSLPGVTPWVVPNGEFYRIDTALVVPRLSAQAWSLRVWGEVEREVTLTWAQLLAQPLVSRHVTLACVSNEVGGNLVGNALWTGWPVRELLAQAGPRPGADMVLSRSADGWTAGTPLPVLTDDRDALLAIAMNGEPLPFEHGFPVRLVVPGLYGYVSATKWVTELKVTRFAVDMGYWTPRGWSALGPVKTASRIDVPRSGVQVSPGTVAVAGVAWAMHRGIRAVQVRVDDGPWADARLASEPTVDSWRQWVFDWPATAGSHVLTVRAQDGDGQWQTEQVARSDPDGATGHHAVTVRVA
ncbi:MAG: molybdopterin-dependent oxidoreductase [Candidatus Phosphoribacter sp.]|nr:molybdopterin-dependent oxidoreductase [Actinomycetales bacterium]